MRSLYCLSTQAYPEYVRDKDRCGTSESLDPSVPGEEGALTAPQTAAVPASLNQVSAQKKLTHKYTHTLIREIDSHVLISDAAALMLLHVPKIIQCKQTNLCSSLNKDRPLWFFQSPYRYRLLVVKEADN